MKVVFLCFIASLCVSMALGCYSQTDCKEGYCCTGGITPWLKGVCRKLGKEGDLCDANPPDTGKYFLRCPCIEGLKCVTKENETPRGPLCVK